MIDRKTTLFTRRAPDLPFLLLPRPWHLTPQLAFGPTTADGWFTVDSPSRNIKGVVHVTAARDSERAEWRIGALRVEFARAILEEANARRDAIAASAGYRGAEAEAGVAAAAAAAATTAPLAAQAAAPESAAALAGGSALGGQQQQAAEDDTVIIQIV